MSGTLTMNDTGTRCQAVKQMVVAVVAAVVLAWPAPAAAQYPVRPGIQPGLSLQEQNEWRRQQEQLELLRQQQQQQLMEQQKPDVPPDAGVRPDAGHLWACLRVPGPFGR